MYFPVTKPELPNIHDDGNDNGPKGNVLRLLVIIQYIVREHFRNTLRHGELNIRRAYTTDSCYIDNFMFRKEKWMKNEKKKKQLSATSVKCVSGVIIQHIVILAKYRHGALNIRRP